MFYCQQPKLNVIKLYESTVSKLVDLIELLVRLETQGMRWDETCLHCKLMNQLDVNPIIDLGIGNCLPIMCSTDYHLL